jgi:probable F420-dependent oxidoreductase
MGLHLAPPRLSVSLGLWQDREPLEALDTARLADELGYDELWIGEMATFDAFALAAAIAARTSERLALTVGPLAVAVRDPMALAMGTASVAALGGARPVGLALGSSSPAVVAGWHGREWSRPAARLREAADAVRPLLAGDRAAGGYRLRLASPAGPLTVAAFGDRSIAVAAELADRMVINLVTPELSARLAAELARRANGAPPSLAAWVPAAVDPSDEAVAQMSRGVVPYLAAPGYGEMFAAAGFGELVASARSGTRARDLLERVPPELPRSIGLVGDAAEARSRAAAFLEAGVDELVLVPATAGDPGGERTLRALRDLVRARS